MTDHPKIDRLSALLLRFPPQVRPVFQGMLAPGGECHYAPAAGGMLHLVGSSGMRLQSVGFKRDTQSDGHSAEDESVSATPLQATVLLLPRAHAHSVRVDGVEGVALFSAALDLGSPMDNPLVRALPALMQVPLHNHPELDTICQVLWEEGDAQRCAHGMLLARACEVLVIQLLRHAIANRLVDTGLLSGLADARLVRVLAALHAEPGAPWTLPRMAEVAHMSRARFAAHFASVLGETPGDYLSRWRLGVARSLLAQGLSVKQVASETGYASASALTRAFSRRVGEPPTRWLAAQRIALDTVAPAI